MNVELVAVASSQEAAPPPAARDNPRGSGGASFADMVGRLTADAGPANNTPARGTARPRAAEALSLTGVIDAPTDASPTVAGDPEAAAEAPLVPFVLPALLIPGALDLEDADAAEPLGDPPPAADTSPSAALIAAAVAAMVPTAPAVPAEAPPAVGQSAEPQGDGETPVAVAGGAAVALPQLGLPLGGPAGNPAPEVPGDKKATPPATNALPAGLRLDAALSAEQRQALTAAAASESDASDEIAELPSDERRSALAAPTQTLAAPKGADRPPVDPARLAAMVAQLQGGGPAQADESQAAQSDQAGSTDTTGSAIVAPALEARRAAAVARPVERAGQGPSDAGSPTKGGNAADPSFWVTPPKAEAAAQPVSSARPASTLRLESDVKPAAAPTDSASSSSAFAIPVLESAVATRPTDTVATSATTSHAAAQAQAAEADVHTQVVRAVQMQWADGVGEAKIRLNPEHLGEVTISLRVEQGTVYATVRTESQAAMQAIQARQQELQAALESQGLHLDHLVLSTDPDEQRRQQRSPYYQPPADDESAKRKDGSSWDRPRFEVLA